MPARSTGSACRSAQKAMTAGKGTSQSAYRAVPFLVTLPWRSLSGARSRPLESGPLRWHAHPLHEYRKASPFVVTYPQRQGCHIVPVPPKADSVLGETACPNVESVPESVDVANVFRPPHECPTCAEQAAAIGAGSSAS